MRLIGNKTKLLGEIEGFLARRGVTEGTFLDVFAGTASVGRHFRSLGFRVRTNDLMCSSFVRQVTYITLPRYPSLKAAREQSAVRRFLRSRVGRGALEVLGSPPRGATGLYEVVGYLNRGLAPRTGVIARQYAEGGEAGRLFFSEANGAWIDAVHHRIVQWWKRGVLSDPELHLLLTALLEAADRVANISGTYGAFLKHLQTSAQALAQLRPPVLDTRGPAGRAYRGDGNDVVRRVPVDVLYVDPPYNHRQYVKNYHVIEVLAELHTVRDLRAYEAEIYGKTGLRKFGDRLSDYCRKTARKGPSPCEQAFRDLVAHAKAEHIVISYSEEGILGRDAIGAALAAAAGQPEYDFARDHEEISYKRFRSDKDGSSRSYRVLADRSRDEVREWLFYVRKPRRRARVAS